MKFTFTISTTAAKDLLRDWAFPTPEEEAAVLSLDGPERTEIVHRLMAQNFLPGPWVLTENSFGPTEPRDWTLLKWQGSLGNEWERQSSVWMDTEGREVHEGSQRAIKRLNEKVEENLKSRPEFRSLRAKLNRVRQAAKQAKQACKACQEAEERLFQIRTEVDDWEFPSVGPEALEASRLQRQLNFCSCTSKYETRVEKLKRAIWQLRLEETRKVLETAKDRFGLWKPEFTAPYEEPTEEPDWGLY